MEENKNGGLLQSLLFSGGGSGGGGGGGGGMLKITGTIVDDLPVINKTWQEIHDAEGAYLYSSGDGFQRFWYLAECFVDNGAYRVGFFNPSNLDSLFYFAASSANDIPVFTPNP